MPQKNKPVIMIVDDEKVILDVMSRMMRKRIPEAEIVTCNSGKAALEKAKELGHHITYLVTDYVIGDVFGTELITKVRTLIKKPIPAILMSSLLEKQIPNLPTTTVFLKKPVQSAEVADIVKLFIQKK